MIDPGRTVATPLRTFPESKCNPVASSWILHTANRITSSRILDSKSPSPAHKSRKYKDEFSVGQFRQVDLGHGISIQLEFPSISRYIDDSMSWINSTIAMADRSLTVTNNDNERDNLIIKLANMNMMRIYTHYIKKIIIDDSEITDTETKENSINTISEDLIIRDKFLEEVVKYTTDYTYSITGYPALTNKEAEESYKTIFPSMVSYDPGSFFFILLVQLESPVS